MLMQLGTVAFYAEFCEKLALCGGWSYLLMLTSGPVGATLATFWLPIVWRRENVARRDWVLFACCEAAIFFGLWFVAILDFAFEWPLWLYMLVAMSGMVALYYVTRPLFARIVDPNKRKQRA